jgi:predicted esterase
MTERDPHANAQLMSAGAGLEQARSAMIMIHGRGSTAANILGLAAEFNQPDWAYLAPQAVNNTWYPASFLMPLERNEPHLSSALATVGRAFAQAVAAGIPAERIVLLGFSQGACLALEWAARNAQRFGGVVGLSGGLIGPDGTPRTYAGSLAGTPVFLGCSDIEAHIPAARVGESAAVFERLGATTTARLYPGMGHTINSDEIGFIQRLLQEIGEK